LDVRRLPEETKEAVLARLRRIVSDSFVEVRPLEGPEMPAAPSSPLDSELYLALERVILRKDPKALVVPYLSRGASDSAFLRSRGVAVYGAPLFAVEPGGDRSHGNDERRSLDILRQGARLLWEVVLAVAAEGESAVRDSSPAPPALTRRPQKTNWKPNSIRLG
jgi:acetylornithine deacetylase/succinyl-diaminopimelate desuccinylase-like protein